MHNIKQIRKDFDNFINSLKQRNVNINFDLIIKLDEQNRDLIQKKKILKRKKKRYQKLKIKVYLQNQKKFPNNLPLLPMSKKRLKMSWRKFFLVYQIRQMKMFLLEEMK